MAVRPAEARPAGSTAAGGGAAGGGAAGGGATTGGGATGGGVALATSAFGGGAGTTGAGAGAGGGGGGTPAVTEPECARKKITPPEARIAAIPPPMKSGELLELALRGRRFRARYSSETSTRSPSAGPVSRSSRPRFVAIAGLRLYPRPSQVQSAAILAAGSR